MTLQEEVTMALGLCKHSMVLKQTTRRFLIFECRVCGVTKKQRKTLLYRKMLR